MQNLLSQHVLLQNSIIYSCSSGCFSSAIQLLHLSRMRIRETFSEFVIYSFRKMKVKIRKLTHAASNDSHLRKVIYLGVADASSLSLSNEIIEQLENSVKQHSENYFQLSFSFLLVSKRSTLNLVQY